MFDNYEEIFAQRAWSYHKAMEQVPDARRHEFLLAAKYLQIEADNVICDIPAGGGYLKRFIDVDSVCFRFLETSEDFARHCPSGKSCETDLCTFEHLPLKTNSVDRILSLAALHHVDNPATLFQELRRILRADGKLVLADVAENSGPGRFLNIFVDQHNSMGHRGNFLQESTTEQLIASGFTIDFMKNEKYPWVFDSEEQMVEFSRDLFGLDKATERDILRGIEHYLGFSKVSQTTQMNWELTFIRAHPSMGPIRK